MLPKKLTPFNKILVNGLLTFVISIITTISFSVSGFYHYIEKKTLQDQVRAQNREDIQQIKKELLEQQKRLNSFELKYETESLKLNTVKAHLLNTINYQQILRVEVKAVAENKLDKVDFWRILNLAHFNSLQRNRSKQ